MFGSLGQLAGTWHRSSHPRSRALLQPAFARLPLQVCRTPDSPASDVIRSRQEWCRAVICAGPTRRPAPPCWRPRSNASPPSPGPRRSYGRGRCTTRCRRCTPCGCGGTRRSCPTRCGTTPSGQPRWWRSRPQQRASATIRHVPAPHAAARWWGARATRTRARRQPSSTPCASRARVNPRRGARANRTAHATSLGRRPGQVVCEGHRDRCCCV